MLKKSFEYLSSPTQYIHSPFGDKQAATKSPPSLLPDEKLFTTYTKIMHKNHNQLDALPHTMCTLASSYLT